ncbi:MAG: hypothetical protein PX634_07635, partial [Microcystis sp. M53600_WE12]|nr:hypothetical protein [Microcystis sp. M53600_WE12]
RLHLCPGAAYPCDCIQEFGDRYSAQPVSGGSRGILGTQPGGCRCDQRQFSHPRRTEQPAIPET